MTALEISCIAVGGAGVLIALISILFFTYSLRLKKKCSAQTMGTVIDYKYKRTNHATSIAPITEFWVDGQSYTAYRHYKGVVSTKKISGNHENAMDQAGSFYISENDWFHKSQNGVFANYSMLAREKWPMGSELPVVYNRKKPKQAYVEKVVVISNIVGTVLASVGAGIVAIAGIVFLALN